MRIYGYKKGKELSFADMKKEVKSILENNPNGLGLTIEEIVNNLSENNIRHFSNIDLAAILNKLINKDEIWLSCKGTGESIDIVFWPNIHYKQDKQE